MDRSLHFEIFAENPARMAGFYAQAFGLEFKEEHPEEGYSLVDGRMDGQCGLSGRVGPRPALTMGGMPTIHVVSVADAIKRVAASGGRLLVPRRAIPGVGWMAYCEDPEGNSFGVFEHDSEAV
ncbi:Glyoxalase-like domain containing protein [Desulfovibrio sp. X2]|uniref:VOC family protein n=1 Tax=Desulfovibrio sp. X2 TaxID=941449 RepID=UPI000358EF10|nr:VOC family protein [Desulfovibrio sp. X2]EPR44440.1 Glyoxalase-like domain containing protein [Desulfovibrio sp. X2]